MREISFLLWHVTQTKNLSVSYDAVKHHQSIFISTVMMNRVWVRCIGDNGMYLSNQKLNQDIIG